MCKVQARRTAPMSSSTRVSRFNPVFRALGTTIFTVMSALAAEHRAVNLGQGFPDDDGPLAIREAASRALIDGPNQYPPTRGLMALRCAISAHAARYYGLTFDAEREVLVTSGATEALTACILGLTGPRDEVILIEPAYDSYRPIAEAAGATIRTVKLVPPDWRLTREALAAAVTSKTRAIILNTPLNPIGRAFDRGELDAVADVLRSSNAFAICDEVYEHLVFDGREHIPLATLDGHARPRRPRRLGRKDVLPDGLEDRVGDGRQRADRCHRLRSPVSHFHDVTGASTGDSSRPRARDGFHAGAHEDSGSQSRSPGRRTSRGSDSTCCPAREHIF